MNRDEKPLSVDKESTETDPLLLSKEDLEAFHESERQKKNNKHRKVNSLFTFTSANKHKKRAHHRATSSIGEFLEAITENVVVEAKELHQTWVDELDESKRGKRYFLDMTLTRSLSILPETLTEFVEETTGIEQEVEAPESATSIGRYLSLLTAVLAISSNASALSLLHGVAPAMKLYWRMCVTGLFLSYFAIKIMYKDGFPQLTTTQWMAFIGSVVCAAAHSICFNTSIEYTSIGNAVVLANSQALLLFLGKLLMGESVVWMEGCGVIIAFAGCILCTTAESTDDDHADKDPSSSLFGDFLAFLSAVFGVLYLTFAKSIRHTMAVSVFMFLIMFCGSFVVLFYLFVAGFKMELSNDPYIGLFGWMTLTDHHIYIITHIALICNILGTMGFVRAMQYFENVVIAVATLLEPMTATMIAFLVGVGDLPGPLGWTGNVLVVIGTLGVVYPTAKSGGSVDH